MVSALTLMLLRDLRRLRGQTIAVALVTACGVALFITMRGAYQSLVLSQAAYYDSYRFADVFAHLKRAPDAITEQIRQIPGVAAVRTRIVMDVTLDVPGLHEPATGRLVSIPEHTAPMLNDVFLRQGRYIEAGRTDEVLVSEAFAAANALQLGDRIGAILNGRWKQLRLVGVALSPEYIYEIGGSGIFPDNKRFGVLWMNEKVLGPAFDMDGAFNDVVLSLAPGATTAEVLTRLDLLLTRYGGLGAYGREDQLSHRFLSDEIAQNRISSTYVPAIFLTVAAFLVHLVLSRLVSLQRTEIALLKAFGYHSLTVGLHYLKLGWLMVIGGVALGAVGGVYLGSKMIALYREFYRFPHLIYHVDPALIGVAALISVGAAALGAAAAVRKAVGLPPAEAMRPEPPARFRASWVERSGLHLLLPASARMIVRNLTRRPGKAALSTLGLALAVAILVVGGYFLDAMRYLIRVQFRAVQCEDATVWFHEPRSSRVRYEIARLPGVLLTEPFRSVPVRLRFHHRSRRLELTGLTPGGELRRLLDARLQPVALTPAGMVLTTQLAEGLHVAPGDWLTVEVLEGERPVRSVLVTGLVDELIGVAAYMDIQALHRLLREGESISGAYLAVDAQHTDQLYAVLKQTPAVSSVVIREAMLRSFEEILARSLLVSTMINLVFACIIAAGVVYNSARVTLSERSHELASLRVLGFTTQEITVILLGEQTIVTAVAIPLGWTLGFGICAALSRALTMELYRIPLVVSSRTYLFSCVVIIFAALASGLFVARRLRHLDLLAVLKARE
ncbi:MAG TPA: FtsX-like permease family protein [Methylomirabilota bacterium]|nr:FtsX-like permease family protein [Methylomirabilota bacterium]